MLLNNCAITKATKRIIKNSAHVFVLNLRSSGKPRPRNRLPGHSLVRSKKPTSAVVVPETQTLGRKTARRGTALWPGSRTRARAARAVPLSRLFSSEPVPRERVGRVWIALGSGPSPLSSPSKPSALCEALKRAVTEKSEFPAWFSFPRVLTGRIARFQIHPEGQEPSEACSIFGHRCAPDTAQRSGWRSRRTWRHLVSTVVLLLEKRSASPAHYGSHHGRLAPQVHLHGGPWVSQGAHPDQQVSLLFFLSSFSL